MASHSSAFASLRINDFRLYLSSRVLTTVGLLMQQTVTGWQVYELTNDKLALGFIGLSEAIPFILSTFYSGYASDRFNRKKLLVLFTSLLAAGMFLLSFLSSGDAPLLAKYSAVPIYVVLGLNGMSRSFLAPMALAIQARIVPRNLYTNAATWSGNVFFFGAIIGPLIGGWLLEWNAPTTVYALVGVLVSASAILAMRIPDQPVEASIKKETFFESFKGGIKFVFGTQAIVSAISLDLFAVLFGGVSALLPAFCKDVLMVGPTALGLLKTAQFIGSGAMGLVMAYYPPTINAGRNLLGSIALFGLCIIGFALSENFALSFVFLFMSGVFDNVSVVIRSTILQLFTPDNMRGRVGAVNSIFVKSSNEIGDFEGGLAARYLGLVPAVIFGGSMTLLVVGGTYLFAPALRRLKL
jgi:MFS family permease